METFWSKSPHSQKHTHQASEDGSSGREKPVIAMDEKPQRQKLPPPKELGRCVPRRILNQLQTAMCGSQTGASLCLGDEAW